MPKTVERGHFEIFLTSILLQNFKKLKGGIFGDMKKNCEKSHKAEITCTKNFCQGRDSNPRPPKILIWQKKSLADLKKS